jgi:hypothetical protein
MKRMLTDKAEREIEELWRLRKEAVQLLDLVVAEWRTDPLSVQCFDARTVTRSVEVTQRLKTLERQYEQF